MRIPVGPKLVRLEGYWVVPNLIGVRTVVCTTLETRGRSQMTDKKYNPGSKEAISAGCKCPVLDNSHGKGYYGQEGVFVYSGGCEYHADILAEMIDAND
jgi:hypothetical protein